MMYLVYWNIHMLFFYYIRQSTLLLQKHIACMRSINISYIQYKKFWKVVLKLQEDFTTSLVYEKARESNNAAFFKYVFNMWISIFVPFLQICSVCCIWFHNFMIMRNCISMIHFFNYNHNSCPQKRN